MPINIDDVILKTQLYENFDECKKLRDVKLCYSVRKPNLCLKVL